MSDTNGGAYIGGSVNTGGGKFVSGNSVEVNIGTSKTKESYQPPIMMGNVVLAGEGFPDGAILAKAFVGGTMRIPHGNYKLLQPVTQKNRMYVYIKV